ncbi:hypothetical protein B0H13DRAFT_2657928 [Mycena leptocephala]|nr:hypothetical protein B0H13DRAFT_2657928 [Mycena leptocephala]
MPADLKKTRYILREGSRAQLPRFNPQLPRAVWQKFKKDSPDSIIFTPFFSDMRHQIFTLKMNRVSLEGPNNHSRDGPTFDDFFSPILTIASARKPTGDLPLAYECVRLGTPIEFKDRRGYSALYFACTTIKNFLLPDFVALQVDLPTKPKDVEKFAEGFVGQLIQICLLLLEQHADANEMHDGLSLLGLACLSDQWDLIRALLIHGASTSPSSGVQARRPVSFFKTPHDRSGFDEVAARFAGKPRPHRLCPCGSKRALKDCHSKAQPFPEMYWIEVWSPAKAELQRLAVPRASSNPMVQKMVEEQQIHDANAPHSEYRERHMGLLDYIRVVLKRLENQGEIDPAYAAAGFKVLFFPLQPRSVPTMPKTEVLKSVQLWNNAVDEYIASGVDSRPTETIENAAKVGMTGGPLYRSGCKIAVYCSHECQTIAWKSHKVLCRQKTVKVQMLPSQEAYVTQPEIKMLKGWNS